MSRARAADSPESPPGPPPGGRATSERPRNHDHRGSRDSRERSSGPLQPCASA